MLTSAATTRAGISVMGGNEDSAILADASCCKAASATAPTALDPSGMRYPFTLLDPMFYLCSHFGKSQAGEGGEQERPPSRPGFCGLLRLSGTLVL